MLVVPHSPISLARWLDQLALRFDQAGLVFGHGTDNAWDEAVALTLGALEWADDARLLDTVLSVAQLARLETLAQRRIAERIPVSLLLGRAQFAGLSFLTAPNVMIPRSPIAELLRNSFRPWLRAAPATVLDVCCGGGCIGISIADQFPDASVVLADVDAEAVALSRRNVELHKLNSRVEVVQGDLYAPLATRTFDLIVSNPPYVPTADSDARPPEFLHEPSLAYDGGEMGMTIVRRLLAGAHKRLNAQGLLVIEVGQWRDVVEREWPRVPFTWPELVNGGEGVLVLEASVVAEHTEQLGLDLEAGAG